MKRLDGMVIAPDGAAFPGRVVFSTYITAVEPASRLGRDYILPGLIDLQVNGSDDVNVLDAGVDDLRRLAAALAREGTTALLAAVITSPIERIEAADGAIAKARETQARERLREAAILGMHLEGPFISPARLGVHPPLNLLPQGAALDRALALDSLSLVTLAPELDGAPDAIRRFIARGAVVSLGHSDATFEQANAALTAGARMFTHLFNAMRPLRHRDPGITTAAMLTDDAFVALIPDGVHVDPAVLKLAVRTRGAGGIIITTDRSAVAAIGNLPLGTVGGAARRADGTLAASTISMLDGVRLMVEKAGVTIGEAVRMASANPAALLVLRDRGRIAPGARADLIVLDRDLSLKAVLLGGREIR